jgi:hypothetical protein
VPAHENKRYTAADCAETGYAMPIVGKVIVIRPDILPNDHLGQLFLCTGGFGANPNPGGRAVFAVSLSTGEHCRRNRGDVIGTLKPELLPDDESLYLSQIRPTGANDVQNPEYSGYCFLENGQYSAGVWLRDPNEAAEYMEMQAPYQYRILICDRNDFAVAEMIQGRLIHPSPEEMEVFRRGEPDRKQTGGMKMT